MASETNPDVGFRADRDLYLSDKGEVVERGDANAATLLAAPGSFIEPAIVKRYGLSLKGGKVQAASVKERADKAREEGMPLDLGTPNEGQLKKPGEPEILVPRTAVMRGEAAPREIHKIGEEVDLSASRTIAVSNVPPEDDKIRLEHYEATKKEGEGEKAAAEKEEAASARKSTAKKTARKAGARKGTR